MSVRGLTVPVTVLVALCLSLITIFAQLWLLNDLLLDFPQGDLFLLFGILLASGLLFALACRRICRLIADRSVLPPVWLTPMLNALARRFEIRPPEIHTLNSPGLNAFALQGLSRRGHILLNVAMLTQLNQDEVEAVLAHECSHIASYHAMMLTVVQGMTLPMTLPIAVGAGLFYAFIYGLDKFRSAVLTLNHIMTVLLFPLTSIGLALFTRYWEFEADRQAAQAVGTEKYISVLQCLHGSFFQHPNLLEISAGSSGRENRYAWALSHPSLTVCSCSNNRSEDS